MSNKIIRSLAIIATILAIISNIYVFTYPSLNPTKCSWKCFTENAEMAPPDGASAFQRFNFYVNRYLQDVLIHNFAEDGAQPEADTSESEVKDLHIMALGDPQINGIWSNTPYISRLDIYGNDHYLGHIISTMRQRLTPSHIVVLGDLFSSQWIPDHEFYNRTRRYVSRLFNRDTSIIEDSLERNHVPGTKMFVVDWKEWAGKFLSIMQGDRSRFEFGYEDVYKWVDSDEYLLVNVSGNHDIGYSGDATYQHMTRFHEVFGKDNYWIEYDVGTDHSWRLVVLNDLLLEGPALQPEFVEYDWEFLRQLQQRNFTGSTVLVTHVPFYKAEGLCYDPPSVVYYPEGYEKEPYKAHLLRSQNHISQNITNNVLDMIFNNGKPGIVLAGHDHEGCEVYFNKMGNGNWIASKEPRDDATFTLHEVTVRSMMGDFHGNTGLLNGHFNQKTRSWEWTFTLCPFSVQHFWWFSKVTAILSGFFCSLWMFS